MSLILLGMSASAAGADYLDWNKILFWGGLLLLAIGFGLLKFIGINVRRKDTLKTLGAVSLGLWVVFFSGWIATVSPPVATAPSSQSFPQVVSACPDTGITTAYIKLQDDYASTETYLGNSNLYALNKKTGLIEGNTTSSTNGWATMSLTCDPTEPIEYEIYATTKAGETGSAKGTIVANKKDVYSVLHTNQLSYMEVRVKDVVNDDWEYLIAHDQLAGTNGTTYTILNKTHVFESSSGDAISVGVDGYVDLLIYVKSATARKFGNDKGKDLNLKNYLCVDVGTDNEWDKDSFIVSITANGNSLPNVKNALDEDSLDYPTIQNSEACYEIGDITDVAKEIRFYAKAKSGQDPDSSNDDLTFYIYSEGTYKSNEMANKIKRGIATDGSSPALVVSNAGYVPEIIVEIQ